MYIECEDLCKKVCIFLIYTIIDRNQEDFLRELFKTHFSKACLTNFQVYRQAAKNTLV